MLPSRPCARRWLRRIARDVASVGLPRAIPQRTRSRGGDAGLAPPTRELRGDASLLRRMRRENLCCVPVAGTKLAGPSQQKVALGEVDFVGRLPPAFNRS